MTLLYREELSTDRPPEFVAAAVDRHLGNATSDAEGGESDPAGSTAPGTRRWHAVDLGGLYRHEVTLDPGTGTLARRVRGPAWFGPLSVGAGVAGVGAALARVAGLGVGETLLVVLLWVAAVSALLPVGHLVPGLGIPGSAFEDVAETVGRRLSPVAVPPFLGLVAVLWAGLRHAGLGIAGDAVVAVLLPVGIGVYYAGNGLPVTIDAGGVPAVGLALSALVPGLVAAGNVVVAGRLVGGEPPEHVDLALAACVALNALFFVYCRVALRSFGSARVEHVESRGARLAGLALLFAVNGALVAGILGGAGLLVAGALGVETTLGAAAGVYPEYDAIASVFGGFPAPVVAGLAAAFYLLLALPVVVTAAGWVAHLASALTVRGLVLVRSTAVDLPGTPVEVRVASVGAPVVRPVTLGPRRFVLVDRSVRDGLADEELAAVVLHEAYHLEHRGPASRLLAGVAAIAVGGRNALLAFHDYPAIERAADDHAAGEVGADSLVRALRRMERLRYEHGHVGRDGGDPVADLRALLVAPSRLFFGPVLLDGAHGDVDRRVERLTRE